jgi:hypothetical protein
MRPRGERRVGVPLPDPAALQYASYRRTYRDAFRRWRHGVVQVEFDYGDSHDVWELMLVPEVPRPARRCGRPHARRHRVVRRRACARAPDDDVGPAEPASRWRESRAAS